MRQRSNGADLVALNGAEAMWGGGGFAVPVYGDPECHAEEYSDAAIRCAQRGKRWIKLAQVHGFSLTNRRFREELRARYGYGKVKQPDTPCHFESRDEYGRALARYLEELKAITDAYWPAGCLLLINSID